jgi:hypothetical protein
LASIEKRLTGIERKLERVQAPAPPLDPEGERPPRVKAQDPQFRRVAKRIAAEGRTLLGSDRLWILWQAAVNAARLGPLPAAEVGSYRGGSARFLAEAFHAGLGMDVELHVIDTFAGHPEASLSDADGEGHVSGLFGDTDAESVREYLAPHAGVRVHVGAFADVRPELPDASYGFAHLDVDLYEPMLDTLRFFGPRLAIGGVLVLDDYDALKCPGVRAASDAYLAETDARFHSLIPHTKQLVLTRVG